ncbi:hypothetical protein CDL15_Pgr018979 [Punica granatum]|uniref:Uncharacterized protein n=1 Tax=Punica granatum TaxID=22663 RepID=A0A218XJH4_PUNGR|nr:hypothetical protein CDL15_Pgr018979 [Punica granatum]PKI74055.1 hypothetical protein CRG98_005533 [Punica granatum]
MNCGIMYNDPQPFPPPPLPPRFRNHLPKAEYKFFIRKTLTNGDMDNGLHFVGSATSYFQELPDSYQDKLYSEGVTVQCYFLGGSCSLKIFKGCPDRNIFYRIQKDSSVEIVARLALQARQKIDCWGVMSPHHGLTIKLDENVWRYKSDV